MLVHKTLSRTCRLLEQNVRAHRTAFAGLIVSTDAMGRGRLRAGGTSGLEEEMVLLARGHRGFGPRLLPLGKLGGWETEVEGVPSWAPSVFSPCLVLFPLQPLPQGRI